MNIAFVNFYSKAPQMHVFFPLERPSSKIVIAEDCWKSSYFKHRSDERRKTGPRQKRFSQALRTAPNRTPAPTAEPSVCSLRHEAKGRPGVKREEQWLWLSMQGPAPVSFCTFGLLKGSKEEKTGGTPFRSADLGSCTRGQTGAAQ